MFFRIRKRHKRKEQFYNWFLTYLLILLISVAISSSMYFVYSNILTSEIEKSTQNFLGNMKDVTELKLQGIESTGYNLMNTSAVNSIAYSFYYNYSNVKVIEWIRNVMDDNQYRMNDAFIRNSIIVFEESDIVVDTSTKFTKKTAYNLMFEDYFNTQEEWLEFIFSTHVNDYRVLNGKNGQKMVVYLQTYPLNKLRKPNTVNMVIIDTEAIAAHMQNFNGIRESQFYILDEQWKEIVGDGNWELLNIVSNDIQSDTDYMKYENRDHIVLNKVGRKNHWNYVYVIPKHAYLHRARSIGAVTITIQIVCVLIGLVLATYFSFRSYRPIKNIISKLPTQLPDNGDDTSELSYIENSIIAIINDRDLMNERLNKQILIQQKVLLQEVLKNRLGEAVISKKFNENQVEQGRCYGIALFNVMGFGVTEGDYQMVHFLITNVFTELMGDDVCCYFSEVDNMYACLIIHKMEEVSIECTKLKAITCIDFLTKHLEIELVCAVSNLADEISNIPEIYDQAVEIMSYFFIKNSEPVLTFYDTIHPAVSAYEYNMETEKKLLNCMLIGDYGKAKEILDRIFNNNFNNDILDIKMAKMLIYEVGNTVLKAIKESRQNLDIIIEDEILLSGKLFELGTIDEIKIQLDRVIYQLCESIIENSAQQKKDSRVTQIMDIIHENYKDPNLSVGMISEKIGISLNYVSKHFKEVTGQGAADYIIRYRIEKAKHLIETTDLKINAVGVETGFYNTNVFIRAFKNTEGITPGQYKQKYTNNRNGSE